MSWNMSYQICKSVQPACNSDSLFLVFILLWLCADADIHDIALITIMLLMITITQ
jgi:hypothetical protein